MWLYNLGNRGFDQYLDYAAARKGGLSLALAGIVAAAATGQ